jgi:hypothetical protein
MGNCISHLVVDICDVDLVQDLVAKIILNDTAQDVEGEVGTRVPLSRRATRRQQHSARVVRPHIQCCAATRVPLWLGRLQKDLARVPHHVAGVVNGRTARVPKNAAPVRRDKRHHGLGQRVVHHEAGVDPCDDANTPPPFLTHKLCAPPKAQCASPVSAGYHGGWTVLSCLLTTGSPKVMGPKRLHGHTLPSARGGGRRARDLGRLAEERVGRRSRSRPTSKFLGDEDERVGGLLEAEGVDDLAEPLLQRVLGEVCLIGV